MGQTISSPTPFRSTRVDAGWWVNKLYVNGETMGKLNGGNKYPTFACPIGVKRVDYKYGSYTNDPLGSIKFTCDDNTESPQQGSARGIGNITTKSFTCPSGTYLNKITSSAIYGQNINGKLTFGCEVPPYVAPVPVYVPPPLPVYVPPPTPPEPVYVPPPPPEPVYIPPPPRPEPVYEPTTAALTKKNTNANVVVLNTPPNSNESVLNQSAILKNNQLISNVNDPQEVPVPEEKDNTMLYVGLGVGGGIVTLAIIGFMVWKVFFKH